MLSLMRRKGLVRRSRGPRGYLWAALQSHEATASGMIQRLIEQIFDGSAKRLLAHLIQGGRLKSAERREILKLLRETREADPSRDSKTKRGAP
jgi:predicted transcriptional regulator